MKIFVLLFSLLTLTSCGFSIESFQEENILFMNSENCWACSLYVVTFGALGDLINNVFVNLTQNALVFLAVCFLFWLVIFTLKTINSTSEPDFKKYWLTLSILLGKIILVSVLLSQNGSYLKEFINSTITPLINIIILFARDTFETSVANSYLTSGSGEEFNFSKIIGQDGISDNAIFFTRSLAESISKIIFSLSNVLNFGWTFAKTYLLSTNPLQWFVGLAIFIINFCLIWSIPFMFVDSFIRIGGILLLSPFFLVAWVFPEGKRLMKAAFELITDAVVQLFLTCVIMSLFTLIIISWFSIKQNSNVSFANIKLSSEEIANNPDFLKQFMYLGVGEPFLILLFFVFMLTTIKQLPKISGYFGGDNSESELTKLIGQIGSIASKQIYNTINSFKSILIIIIGSHFLF